MFRKMIFLVVFPVCLCLALPANPSTFSVPGGTLPAASLIEGSKGVAYTVIKGNEVVSFPVTVLSVMPSPKSPHNLILVKASGSVIEETGGIAAGMSGSPVFIGGKLVGAIGYGWSFSEHQMGLVTPIDEMAKIWNWTDKVPSLNVPELKLQDPASGDLNLLEPEPGGQSKVSPEGEGVFQPPDGGYSPRRQEIADVLGNPVILLPGGGGACHSVEYKQSRGPQAGVLVAWGDVVCGDGHPTAVSTDGRFLAFAHPSPTAQHSLPLPGPIPRRSQPRYAFQDRYTHIHRRGSSPRTGPEPPGFYRPFRPGHGHLLTDGFRTGTTRSDRQRPS